MAVRAAQSPQAEKPLKKKVFANRDIPHSERHTTWTALSFSGLFFHASIRGRMSSTNWKAIDNRYRANPRMVLARPKVQGARTNLGVKADAKALPLDDFFTTRRLGLMKRALDSAPQCCIGLIQATDRAPRSWAKLIRADLEWLDAHEPGPPQPFEDLVAQVASIQPHQWKNRFKKVKTANILVQATQNETDILNRYQQDAYGTVGISIGPQEAPTEWPCNKCHSLFTSKQGLRFHQAIAHSTHHVAFFTRAQDVLHAGKRPIANHISGVIPPPRHALKP